MGSTRHRVWLCSRPAIGREHYRGKVDVVADDTQQVVERARERWHLPLQHPETGRLPQLTDQPLRDFSPKQRAGAPVPLPLTWLPTLAGMR